MARRRLPASWRARASAGRYGRRDDAKRSFASFAPPAPRRARRTPPFPRRDIFRCRAALREIFAHTLRRGPTGSHRPRLRLRDTASPILIFAEMRLLPLFYFSYRPFLPIPRLWRNAAGASYSHFLATILFAATYIRPARPSSADDDGLPRRKRI